MATKEFHEWVHTGSLYTLVKDDMKTLKYILGSLDDMLEFYSSFWACFANTTNDVFMFPNAVVCGVTA